MKIYYIFLIIPLLFFSSCGGNNSKKERKNISGKELKQSVFNFENPPKFRKDSEIIFINKNNETIFQIDAEIASLPEECFRGLMYRSEMDENQGMLFIMNKEEIQSFYMRNTIIPLDIIYINSNYEIVDIYKNTKTLDETSLPSAEPALFVVEINAGLCDKFNIKKGDKINF